MTINAKYSAGDMVHVVKIGYEGEKTKKGRVREKRNPYVRILGPVRICTVKLDGKQTVREGDKLSVSYHINQLGNDYCEADLYTSLEEAIQGGATKLAEAQAAIEAARPEAATDTV